MITKYGNQFLSEIGSEDFDKIKDVGIEVLEGLIDSEIKNETLRMLPGINICLAVFHASKSISDRLFVRKVFLFLKEQATIDETSRKEMINKLSKDENFGARILHIINNLDDENKAKCIGKLFVQLVAKKITREEFLRVSLLIQQMFLDDLKLLYSCSTGTIYRPGFEHLERHGLIEKVKEERGENGEQLFSMMRFHYSVTQFGSFVQFRNLLNIWPT